MFQVLRQWLVWVWMLGLLAACGGGGGGGGGPNSGARLSLERNALSFSAVQNGATPNPQTVGGTVTGADSSVFIVVTLLKTDVVANVDAQVSVSSGTGAVLVFPQDPANLGPGTYSETITVQVCNDQACGSQISGSPQTITVTYVISPDPLLVDTDQDGVPDVQDALPNDPTETVDLDMDGIGDNADTDDDGDMVPDDQDAFPRDPAESSDLDSDGIGDNADTDRDGDGFDNDREGLAGTDPDDASSIPTEFTSIAPALLNVSNSGVGDVLSADIGVTSNNGRNINWAATTSAVWLRLTNETGSVASGSAFTVSLLVDELFRLGTGNFTAEVTLTADDPTVPSTVVTIQLDQQHATFQYLAPYVAYSTDLQANEHVLRGAGFSSLAGPVFVGGQPAANITVLSDSELRISFPPLAPGRYPIQVQGPLAAEFSNAELVVRDRPTLADVDLAIALTGRVSNAVYDDERALLFANTRTQPAPSDPLAPELLYRLDGNNNWAATSQSYPGLRSFALSPDGRYLIALTSDKLMRVDPDTLATMSEAALPDTAGSPIGIIALNDGMIYLPGSNWSYSLLLDEFVFAGTEFADLFGLISGADGSRMIGVSFPGPGPNNVRFLDAGDDVLRTAPLSSAFAFFGGLDRHAERLILDYALYDAAFTPLGPIASQGFFSPIISPTGHRSYEYVQQEVFLPGLFPGDINFLTQTELRVADLTTAPPFSQVGAIPITGDAFGPLRFSLDGRLLFMLSPTRMTVRNVNED